MVSGFLLASVWLSGQSVFFPLFFFFFFSVSVRPTLRVLFRLSPFLLLMNTNRHRKREAKLTENDWLVITGRETKTNSVFVSDLFGSLAPVLGRDRDNGGGGDDNE